jgi:hypothetical protein
MCVGSYAESPNELPLQFIFTSVCVFPQEEMVLRLPSSRDTPGGYIRKNTKETVLFYNIKINRPTPFGVGRFIIYSAFCNAHFFYTHHVNRAQAPPKDLRPKRRGQIPHMKKLTRLYFQRKAVLFTAFPFSFLLQRIHSPFPRTPCSCLPGFEIHDSISK